MNYWGTLKEKFDTNIPRRTALFIKPDINGLCYLYPQEFSNIGYYMVDSKKTGYEETKDFELSFYNYVYPSSSSENEASKISFTYKKQEMYPSYIDQLISFTNIGIEMDSNLISNNKGYVLWNLHIMGKSLKKEKRTIYILVKGKDIKTDNGQVIINTENNIYHMNLDHDYISSYEYYDQMNQDIINNSGKINNRTEKINYILIGRDIELGYKDQIDWDIHIQSKQQPFNSKNKMLSNNIDFWNEWYKKLENVDFKTSDEKQFYYKCWTVIRLNSYKDPILGHAVLECLPVYKGYWFWSLPAIVHYSLKFPDDNGKFFKRLIDMFMSHQREDGYITHAIYIDENIPGESWMQSSTIQSPNISWSIWQYYRNTKDKTSLAKWYKGLLKFYDYMCNSRDIKSIHLWCIFKSYDTGLDTTPVFDDCTYGGERYCYPSIFAAERMQFEHVLGLIENELNLKSDYDWNIEYNKTKSACSKYLWDKDKKWYGVLKENGSLDTRVGIDGVFLFSYGLVDDQKAIAAKKNFEKLIGKYGIRTVAPHENGFHSGIYWRGSAWPTSCSYVLGAVSKYYPDLKDRVWQSTIEFALNLPNIWECFDADTGEVARSDQGFLSTPGMSSNVGAGELLRAFEINKGKEMY